MATKYGLSSEATAELLFLRQQKRTGKGSTPKVRRSSAKAILLPDCFLHPSIFSDQAPFSLFFQWILQKGVDKVKKGATVE